MFIKLSSNMVVNSDKIVYYDDSKILVSGEPNVIPIVTKDYQMLNKVLCNGEDSYDTTIPHEIDTKINNVLVHGVINVIDALEEAPNAYNIQLTLKSEIYSSNIVGLLRDRESGKPITIEINSGTSYATKWTFMDDPIILFDLYVPTNELIIVSVKYKEETNKND